MVDWSVDGSTGLYYFGARFYSPALQRFITEDSFPGMKEDPQSLNRYAYVMDNPISKTDPSGNCADFYSCLSTSSPPPPTQTSSSSGTVGLPVYAGGSTAGEAPGTGGGETSPPPTPPPPPNNNGGGGGSGGSSSTSTTPTCSHCVTNAPNGNTGSGMPPQVSNSPRDSIPPLTFATHSQEVNTLDAWAAFAEIQGQIFADLAAAYETHDSALGLYAFYEQIGAAQALAYLLKAGLNENPGEVWTIFYGVLDGYPSDRSSGPVMLY